MDSTIPKKIYLQWYDEDGVEIQTDFMNERDVLWCEDRIDDTDIEYHHVSEIERLKELLKKGLETETFHQEQIWRTQVQQELKEAVR